MAKILVVDNAETALTSVTGSLRGAGIEVLEAHCIPGALELCRISRPDVIVCAESFADLDAADLLEIKRSEPALNDIGVAIVGTNGDQKIECFKLGCDDFIQLPVEDAEIFFRICALLRRLGGKGVRGSFQDISILDLIQMLAAAQRSGRLVVDFQSGGGALFFDEGQVFHATLGKETGEDAFLSVLRASQKGGSFAFSVEDCSAVHKTIDKRTDHLLLGLASQLDEELGDLAA